MEGAGGGAKYRCKEQVQGVGSESGCNCKELVQVEVQEHVEPAPVAEVEADLPGIWVEHLRHAAHHHHGRLARLRQDVPQAAGTGGGGGGGGVQVEMEVEVEVEVEVEMEVDVEVEVEVEEEVEVEVDNVHL